MTLETNSHIRIAFLASVLTLGGSERQLLYFFQRVDRTRFDPLVITLHGGRGDPYETPIRDLNIPLYSVPDAIRPIRLLRITALLRRLRVRIVESVHFHANAYAGVAGRVLGIQSIGALRNHPDRQGFKRLAFPYLWLCLRSVDLLVSNSRFCANALLGAYLALPPVEVIPNAVPIPETASLPKLRQQYRAEWGIKDSAVIVGSAGTLNQRKNYQLLVAAIARLAPDFPDVHLALAGDGDQRPSLEQQAGRLGIGQRVRFLGRQPNAHRLMPAFDMFCLPSNNEGMPNSVMEAAAAGLPVVATDVGGTSEVVVSEKTGFLVAPNNLDDLTGKIRLLLEQPTRARQIGCEGRLLMRRNFSLDRFITNRQALYQALNGCWLRSGRADSES